MIKKSQSFLNLIKIKYSVGSTCISEAHKSIAALNISST